MLLFLFLSLSPAEHQRSRERESALKRDNSRNLKNSNGDGERVMESGMQPGNAFSLVFGRKTLRSVSSSPPTPQYLSSRCLMRSPRTNGLWSNHWLVFPTSLFFPLCWRSYFSQVSLRSSPFTNRQCVFVIMPICTHDIDPIWLNSVSFYCMFRFAECWCGHIRLWGVSILTLSQNQILQSLISGVLVQAVCSPLKIDH